MPERLANCLRKRRQKGVSVMKRRLRIDGVYLPKLRSTYRMGPPFSGRAQASSADTRAMGRHLQEVERGSKGRDGRKEGRRGMIGKRGAV